MLSDQDKCGLYKVQMVEDGTLFEVYPVLGLTLSKTPIAFTSSAKARAAAIAHTGAVDFKFNQLQPKMWLMEAVWSVGTSSANITPAPGTAKRDAPSAVPTELISSAAADSDYDDDDDGEMMSLFD